MKLIMKLHDSSVKHIIGKENTLKEMKKSITVLKDSEFAFQVSLNEDKPFLCQLGIENHIHWTGLGDKIRLEIDVPTDLKSSFKMSFLGYVKDDDDTLVGDPILNEKSKLITRKYQMIWVEGKVPKEYLKNEIRATVKAYYSQGYEKEVLVVSEELHINIIDYTVKPINEGDFFLDLWQHPSNWARAYNVEYFSDIHFEIIENYLKDLGCIGQRVIDLIVTDYPWAGQRCYEVDKNASNLFEINMVKVFKDNTGRIKCDFSNMDRYIDICHRYGIKEEVNLFGLIGNWDAFSFGSPVEGYKDAMRVMYFNQTDKCFDYIKTKGELKEYFSLLFKYLVDKGLWEKTLIMSDEPNNIDVFNECSDFLQSAIPNHKIKMKSAIHHQRFFEENEMNIKSLSLNTCELLNNLETIDGLKNKIKNKGGMLTWYSCCFPEKLNIFLKSPIIESRLSGWFTYYFDLDGFLRWAYGVWPGNVFEDASYKHPKWAAGDMFLVYPGKDLKPMHSVRYKNFMFGIQDFDLFKALEKKCGRYELIAELELLLGQKKNMVFVPKRSVKMDYSLDYSEYMELRNNLIKKYLV